MLTKNHFTPGSVSRLTGSAHRWDELYAGAVQRKTTESRINCSSIGNNPGTCFLCGHKAGGGASDGRGGQESGRWILSNCVEHGLYRAQPAPLRRLVTVSVLFSLFRAPPNATVAKHMHRRCDTGAKSRANRACAGCARGAYGLKSLQGASVRTECQLCTADQGGLPGPRGGSPGLFLFSRGRFP